MSERFVIGTRGSELALWQANFVKTGLERSFPDHQFDIKPIETTGDKMLDAALSDIGDKGLFTKQIEDELLAGHIDMAVHSLKDLQTVQPEGLTIGAICEREQPNDVFISKSSQTIAELAPRARVATSSMRRRSQLLYYRPDLQIEDIRGNVPTRLRKFHESDLDAMILAYAGIHRLGFDQSISQIIPFEIMLPAVGQGAVAVEVRDGDERTLTAVKEIDDPTTRVCTTAERAFLRKLEGGCQVPIGAIASLDGDNINLQGVVGSAAGTVVFKGTVGGKSDTAESLGEQLADRLIMMGARRLLDAAREQAPTNGSSPT
jgi:hydroxymethylbilane synthase